MKGKVALITGGTYGIGYGIAEVLLRGGCKVAITGRKESKTVEAAEKLAAETQGETLGVSGDVRSAKDMETICNKVTDKFGKLDVVVANAGVGHFGSIEELSLDEWNQTIDTNLTGVFNTVKAAVPEIKKSKGYIITIASLAGTNFFAKGAAYNASKFGLVGFSQAIMLDLRKHGVKVSTIMPGSVTSHFAGHTPSEEDAWKIQPEDIGKLVKDMLEMNPRTLPSKIEVRPSQPPGA
ncbi:MAG: SDR family oxidoreductase [Flavobacteriales bacterium]|nr:SDR family oxidoreductase [Flavobacteriales bacterium]